MNPRAFVFAASIGVACAAVDRVPFCDADFALPIATRECRAEPDAQRVIGELGALIEENAGSYLVSVGFDESGAVGSVCAQRASFAKSSRARAHLRERMSAILAARPKAACLADSRIDFNRAGAKLAEIEAVDRQCSDEARLGADPSIPPRFALENQVRRYRQCIEREQITRGEIWMLDIGQVFVRSNDGAERRKAILACSENRTPIGTSFYDADITEVRAVPSELVECLHSYGWESSF